MQSKQMGLWLSTKIIYDEILNTHVNQYTWLWDASEIMCIRSLFQFYAIKLIVSLVESISGRDKKKRTREKKRVRRPKKSGSNSNGKSVVKHT